MDRGAQCAVVIMISDMLCLNEVATCFCCKVVFW